MLKSSAERDRKVIACARASAAVGPASVLRTVSERSCAMQPNAGAMAMSADAGSAAMERPRCVRVVSCAKGAARSCRQTT